MDVDIDDEIETVECKSCYQDVPLGDIEYAGDSDDVEICRPCVETFNEDGYYQCSCAYNTNREPPGLWGQCYEAADSIIDGEFYCITHAHWVMHSGRCCVDGCDNGITIEMFEEHFGSTGGDDAVMCKKCAKRVRRGHEPPICVVCYEREGNTDHTPIAMCDDCRAKGVPVTQ